MAEPTSHPPGIIRRFMDIRREELPVALLMFAYFFLVITSFWILKPLKKTEFIAFYDERGVALLDWHLSAAQAELVAKVLNLFVAAAATTVFSWLSRRYRRQQLTTIFSAFFMVGYALYSLTLNQPGHWDVWTFYLFGDLFSTLMVATFFVFLNDIVTPDVAKRTYGLVGLGGVSGGVFGASFVRVWIAELSMAAWLWICFGIAAIIILIAQTVARLARRLGLAKQASEIATEDDAHPRSHAALEGARLALRSPYLLSIVGIVGTYEMVSTVMDFQFTATVSHYLNDDAIGKHFATVYTITNITSLFVQLFVTGYVMRNLGVRVALMVLPVAAMLGSAAFMVVPILWVGSLLNTVDNAFNYSINQSAKESLYVPTTPDEKYKAKAFIDMFVMRFAKAVAVFLSLLFTSVITEFSGVRWLSLLTLALCAGWVGIVSYVGRQFDRKAEEEASQLAVNPGA